MPTPTQLRKTEGDGDDADGDDAEDQIVANAS